MPNPKSNESQIEYLIFFFPNFAFPIPNSKLCLLFSGGWFPATGHWLLASGRWLLVPGFRIPHSDFRIQT